MRNQVHGYGDGQEDLWVGNGKDNRKNDLKGRRLEKEDDRQGVVRRKGSRPN